MGFVWKFGALTRNDLIALLCVVASEQDVVKSVVKKLGRYRLVTNVCDTTTHVICGNDRRTLNVLLGICRGSWLLSLEWVGSVLLTLLINKK